MRSGDRLTKWVGVLVVALLIEIGLRECIRVFVDAHFDDELDETEVAFEAALDDREVDR